MTDANFNCNELCEIGSESLMSDELIGSYKIGKAEKAIVSIYLQNNVLK